MAKLGVVVCISYGDFDIQRKNVVAAGPLHLAYGHAQTLNSKRTPQQVKDEVEYRVEEVKNLEDVYR